MISVDTPWGAVSAKVSSYQGRIVNVTPEYEDCRNVAVHGGVALKDVQREALNLAVHAALAMK